MKSQARPCESLDDVRVSLHQLATILDLSAERVRQLAASGIVKRAGHGSYLFAQSVQGYIEYLQAQAARRANPSRDLLLSAKAAGVESANRRTEERTIDIEDVEIVSNEIVRLYREELAGVGAEVGGGDDGRRVDALINGAINRLEARLDAALAKFANPK